MSERAYEVDVSAGFEAADDGMTPPPKPWESASDIPPSPDLEFEPAAPGAPVERRVEERRKTDLSSFAVASVGQGSVPPIKIHIFCLQQHTNEIAEKATTDRRMQRANTSIMPGGLAAAVAHYQNESTPSLVVVESQDGAEELIGLLDQLAEVCDPGTKVVVIGKDNDIALYRQLVKRGVSEYLVPPLDPMAFIQSVINLYNDPSAPFIGRSIAFVGAKGGVGASTIAHNFAYILTELLQVSGVIVDFDLPFGTAGLDFNQDPLQGVADALSQPDRLDPVLLERMMVRCTERLALFAAPANLDNEYDISADAFEEVADKIKTTAPYVILDLPHAWSGWMRRVLLGADEVVLVATPDLASLRNAKNILDLIRAARPNDQPPRLVLNQVGVQGRPEIPSTAFGEAVGAPPSLILPFDPKVFGNASNNGQMIFETQARSKTAQSLNEFVRLLTRREAAAPPTPSRLGALFRR